MNIHEYQAKAVLREFGVPVPRGIAAMSVEEAVKAAEELGGPVWVVKAQIHAGGRGKAGGVKVPHDLDCLGAQGFFSGGGHLPFAVCERIADTSVHRKSQFLNQSAPQIFFTCATPALASSTESFGLNSKTLMCSGFTSGLSAAKSIMPEPGGQ